MGMLVILLVATLLTLSRGALLAVCMGHIALFAVRGWRKTWRCCALLVLVVMVFQVGSPLLTRVSDWQQEVKARIWTGREVKHLVGGVALTQNPVKELYERGDNGRLDLYKHVLSLVSSTQDRILGKGLWASQEVWRKGVIWAPEHMHSVFLSTYYHLGLCGLVALVLLLGYGLRRCVIAARAGEDVWLILAVYGLMAVTFDGHSMQILLSEPRFESLVLWLPLVIGCAASQRLAASSAPVSRVN